MPSLPVTDIHTLIRAQEKAERPRLLAAALCAVVVSVGAVVLLGLSGWFLTASAIAGMGGVLVTKAFNYMIPSAMIRLTAILRTAGRYGERVTSHDAALYALAALRPQLFSALSRAPVAHSLTLSSGEASARLMQDVDAIQNRFVRLSAPWGAGAATLTGLILCAIAEWTTAAIVAACIAGGMVCAALIGHRLSRPAGQQVQATAGRLKDELSSLMAAAPELRAYGMTQWAQQRLAEQAAPYDAAHYKLATSGAWIMASQGLFTALAVAGVFFTAAGGHPALTAMAILGAVAAIDASGTLMTAIRQNGAVAGATGRLDQLIGKAAEVPPRSSPLAPRVSITGLPPLSTRARLGLVGRSGAGKTTLVERLMHLRTPVRGEACLGGVDVADLPPSAARALFSYAPQHPQVLSGTVADNLRLAAPKATEDEMWAALEDACIADRIRASGLGLKMPLQENGMGLSGGERRRLGMARAYLRHASFMVLDEPTEGLDADTEAEVLRRLERRLSLSGQGLILISHRRAPLALCRNTAEITGMDASGRVLLNPLLSHGPRSPNTSSQSVAF